jgi:hypothetical protein
MRVKDVNRREGFGAPFDNWSFANWIPQLS